MITFQFVESCSEGLIPTGARAHPALNGIGRSFGCYLWNQQVAGVSPGMWPSPTGSPTHGYAGIVDGVSLTRSRPLRHTLSVLAGSSPWEWQLAFQLLTRNQFGIVCVTWRFGKRRQRTILQIGPGCPAPGRRRVFVSATVAAGVNAVMWPAAEGKLNKRGIYAYAYAE